MQPLSATVGSGGRTPQGVRGLKSIAGYNRLGVVRSHPARGAWIEMQNKFDTDDVRIVAPRKGCVD